jgi:ATP/ADP translocase
MLVEDTELNVTIQLQDSRSSKIYHGIKNKEMKKAITLCVLILCMGFYHQAYAQHQVEG